MTAGRGHQPAGWLRAVACAVACSVLLLAGMGATSSTPVAAAESAPAAAAAAADDFYTPPNPLGPGAPGDVIRAERFTANAVAVVPLPAKAWRIMYRSTSATGDPVAVTGTVLVPLTAWRGPGKRPLLGIAPGTQGMADRCAVSRQLAAGTEYESYGIGNALLRDWAVAITDYPGLGTPGDHTYVVGPANGHATLDVMRAARNLPDAGIDKDGPLAIFGYSEGGGGAGWALQLQPSYAPDLPLVAGAAGAAPTDYQKLLDFHDGGPFAFLLLYSAIGFNAAYPELQFEQYLTAAGARSADTMRNTCVQDAIILGLASPKDMAHYVDPNPLASPKWQRRLRQSDLGFIRPASPVLVGGPTYDEAIPFEQSELLYQRWCERGANAHLVAFPVGEHLTGGLLGFYPPGFQFIADRLAGKPLPRAEDCVAAAPEPPTPAQESPSPDPAPAPTTTSTPQPPAAQGADGPGGDSDDDVNSSDRNDTDRSRPGDRVSSPPPSGRENSEANTQPQPLADATSTVRRPWILGLAALGGLAAMVYRRAKREDA